MKENDKFEADLQKVERILAQAKADLLSLIPETDAGHDPTPRHAPFVERNHFLWFQFRGQKP